MRKSIYYAMLAMLFSMAAAGCAKPKDGVNGTNGAQGVPGPAATPASIGIIDPCGTAPDIYNEVFLKLSDGTILASFSNNVNGDYTRIVKLTPGTYKTTDADNCTFTIDVNGNLTYESHHN